MKRYIDVSEWQGDIDFAKVKGSVDGIILRAGYGKGNADKKFDRNATECNRLGIPCGAYWFSYAKTAEEAKTEAMYLLKAVAPYRMELPMAFDFEYDSVTNAKKAGVSVSKALASNMVREFCNHIEAAGYWALNYANPDFLNRYFDESVTKRYGLWLASWYNTVDVNKPPRECAIWQWGGSTIPGIVGTVDTNESYTDFAKIIVEKGLNNIKKPSAENGITKPNTKENAVKWAKEYGITDNEEIAVALFNYNNKFCN